MDIVYDYFYLVKKNWGFSNWTDIRLSSFGESILSSAQLTFSFRLDDVDLLRSARFSWPSICIVKFKTLYKTSITFSFQIKKIPLQRCSVWMRSANCCVNTHLQDVDSPSELLYLFSLSSHSKCPPKHPGSEATRLWSRNWFWPIKCKLTNNLAEVSWRKQNNGGQVRDSVETKTSRFYYKFTGLLGRQCVKHWRHDNVRQRGSMF